MDIKKIKELIKLIEDSDLTELEVSEGENTVRLSRVNNQTPMVMQAPAMATTAPTTPAAPQMAEEKAAEISGHAITSPMVGTFYRAPTPEAPSFVEVCQSVNTGDLLCIIEAMKMFNQIEADKAGVIKQILIESGEPVEYGQPLFIIE